MAAVFKRTVAKAKMDHIMKFNDFLSDSKNKAALYKFMAINRAVVPKQLQSSEVLTTAAVRMSSFLSAPLEHLRFGFLLVVVTIALSVLHKRMILLQSPL